MRDWRTSTIVTEGPSGGVGALGGEGGAGAGIGGAAGGLGTSRGTWWSSLLKSVRASETAGTGTGGSAIATGRAAEKAAHAREVMIAREGKCIVSWKKRVEGLKEWEGDTKVESVSWRRYVKFSKPFYISILQMFSLSNATPRLSFCVQ